MKNLILILSCALSIEGREPYLYDFGLKRKKENLYHWLVLYSDIYWPISLKIGVMIERPLSSTCWCEFGWPWHLFKVTDIWEIKNFCIQFQANLSILLDEIQYDATNCCFVLSACYIYFALVLCKGENTADVSLWNICLTSSCVRTCKTICFKLGMMLNTAELYSFIPIWMTLMFTQVHRFMGNRKLLWFILL